MPSPFPGMDPYLEALSIWSDFRSTFLMCMKASLNGLLPNPYLARWGRYYWIDQSELAFTRDSEKTSESSGQRFDLDSDLEESVDALGAPFRARLPFVEAKGKPFLKIIDSHERRVFTMIEMITPAEKTLGPDRNFYLATRQEYFRRGINLVELDFLRSVTRPEFESGHPPVDYDILVSQTREFPRAGLWPLTIRDPLPTIPIPLGPEDEPVRIPLQQIFDKAYDDARYGEEIDYDAPPWVPLREPDAQWARELLAKHSH